MTIWPGDAPWASAIGPISRISNATFSRLAIEKRGLSLRWSSPSNTRSGPMPPDSSPNASDE